MSVFCIGSSQCQYPRNPLSGSLPNRYQQSPHRYIQTHMYLLKYALPQRCLLMLTFLLSGGADKNVVVFDRREEQIVATLKGHTKKVSSVIYHPSQVSALSVTLYTCLHFQSVRVSHISYVSSLAVGGVFGISGQHHPRVVRYRGQLCAGDKGSRGGCYRPISARYRRLPTELI